jgi:hypothetical protein
MLELLGNQAKFDGQVVNVIGVLDPHYYRFEALARLYLSPSDMKHRTHEAVRLKNFSSFERSDLRRLGDLRGHYVSVTGTFRKVDRPEDDPDTDLYRVRVGMQPMPQLEDITLVREWSRTH